MSATVADALGLIRQHGQEADILFGAGEFERNAAMLEIDRVREHMRRLGERCELIQAAATLVGVLKDAPWLESCALKIARESEEGDDRRHHWTYRLHAECSSIRFVPGHAGLSGAEFVPDGQWQAGLEIAMLLDEEHSCGGALLRATGDLERSFVLSREALAGVLAQPCVSAAAAAKVLWPDVMAEIDEQLRGVPG